MTDKELNEIGVVMMCKMDDQDGDRVIRMVPTDNMLWNIGSNVRRFLGKRRLKSARDDLSTIDLERVTSVTRGPGTHWKHIFESVEGDVFVASSINRVMYPCTIDVARRRTVRS